MRGWIVGIAAIAWVAAWSWVFAFSFSGSYFEYNRCSRVPVFAAAMLGVLMIPCGAFILWSRTRTVAALLIGQVCVAGASLAPLAAASFVLARVPGACHLSADDAMGAGIDFLVLAGVAAASVGIAAVAGATRARYARGTRPG